MGDSRKEAHNLFLQVDETVARKRVFCFSISDKKASLEIVLASPNHVFAVGRRGLNGINSETKYIDFRIICQGVLGFRHVREFKNINFTRWNSNWNSHEFIGVKLGLIDSWR